MTRSTISLGRILGIPVGLDFSWFLIFVFVSWSLATGYFPSELPAQSVATYWLMGAAASVLLFVSVLLHEVAHSIVARRAGLEVGSITLYLFGGVSQVSTQPKTAGAEFAMALAGPLASLLLALALVLVSALTPISGPAESLTNYLAVINVSLGIFNLMPGFPLDGGRVLRSLIWKVGGSLSRATSIAGNVGRLVAFGLILVGAWLVLNGMVANGLWLAFIGWFLDSAASAEVRQQSMQDLLAGRKVSDAMSRAFLAVPGDTSLQYLADEYILKGSGRSFVVTRDDLPQGLVTTHCFKSTPREDWPLTPASRCMMPISDIKRVGREDELWDAVQEMDRDGVNQLPVMQESQVVGMLSRDDVISYLRTRKEMGLGK